MASGSDLGGSTWSSSPAPRRRSAAGCARWRPPIPTVGTGRRPRPTIARSADPGVESHVGRPGPADLKPLFEGATSVVHLAQAPAPRRRDGRGSGDGALARRVLDAASAVGAEHVVLLSSAIVYGAWANNPVPLTEDAPLRPNPGVAVAVGEGRARADRRRVARGPSRRRPSPLLRPTVTVAAEGNGWLARALGPVDARSRSPTTSRRRSSSTSTTWRPPSTSPGGPGSTVRATSRPTAGSAATRSARSPAARPGCACRSGSRSALAGSALAVAARADAARRCCRSPCTRGWSPTTGSGRRLGAGVSSNEEAYVARPPGRARGRRSARAAARSWRSAPPGVALVGGVAARASPPSSAAAVAGDVRA